MIPFLAEMKRFNDQVLSARRYRNEEFAPPHSEWCIGINDHNRATNISPAQSICTLNYRPMPGIDVDDIIDRTRNSAKKHGLHFELKHRGEPLYTAVDAPLVRTALKLTGRRKPTTVAYGTDGMAFFKKMKQMIVLGPGRHRPSPHRQRMDQNRPTTRGRRSLRPLHRAHLRLGAEKS